MAYGDKPKRQKDDMGNKGRRSGKGPKPMKGAKKASRESARQERKNLVTENPVVNRSKDSGFDYTQSKKDIKKRYKKMDKASAPGIATIPHGTVSRFQGSTRPLGDTKAMNAMMQKTIKAGLAADLGTKLAKASVSAPIATTGTTKILPTMINTPTKLAPIIKQPLAKKMTKAVPALLDPIEMGPVKTTGSFKPSKRDMELKEAHLGEMQTKKAGGPIKPEAKKAKTKKVVDDMGNKGRKGKGPKKMKKKRTIKAKF